MSDTSIELAQQIAAVLKDVPTPVQRAALSIARTLLLERASRHLTSSTSSLEP